MEFELGQTYEGYQFLELLRKSQDGMEYRVRNLVAQRDELLKVLPSFVRDDQDATAGFLQEARILARLTHPHIIGFYAAQPIDGRMAMTTEWSAFVPLAARLRSGPMPCREALDAADQLLSAIGCLHEQNVVHLDITPETILHSPAGSWKLANFAKARVMNCVPLQGGANGNPRYVSPEQVKGGTLDYRSDLYSLAAVLFEMLCGRPPFDLKSQFELMMAHVSGVPEPPSRFNASLPAELDHVVLRALAKEPHDRWASAGDFREALKAAGKAVSRENVAAIGVEPVLFDAGDESLEFEVAGYDGAAPAVAKEESATELEAVDAADTVEADLSVAVDEPVAASPTMDSSPEPVAAERTVTIEAVLTVAVDEPVAVVPPATDCVPEQVMEAASYIAVDQAAEVATTTDCAAEPVVEAPTTGEPVLSIAVDQPVEVVPPTTACVPERVMEAASYIAVDQAAEVATATDCAAEPVVEAPTTVDPVLAVAVDQPVDVMPTSTDRAPEPVEAALAVVVDEPVEVAPSTDCAAEPVMEAAITVDPVLAVAVDQLVDVMPTSTDRAPEPVEAALPIAVDGPVEVAPTTDCAAEPVMEAATTAEPVLPIAVDESVEVVPTSTDRAPEPAAPEPALAVAVHEPVEAIAPATQFVAAQTALPVEPTLTVEADEPVEAIAPTSQWVAGPAVQVAVIEEPVPAVSLDRPVEPVAAQTAIIPGPVSSVAVDQPIDSIAPATEYVAEPAEPLAAIALEEAVAALPPVAASKVLPAILLPAPKPDLFEGEAAEAMTPPSAATTEAVAVGAPDIPAPAAPEQSPLQANLWAAAAMVAQAAAVVPGPVPEPVTIVPVPAPALASAAAPAITPAPAAAAEAPPNYRVRAVVAAQQPPDSINWIMFGSSAAFLAIVLIAIFLGLR